MGLLVVSLREGVSVFSIWEKEDTVLNSGIPVMWPVRVCGYQVFWFPSCGASPCGKIIYTPCVELKSGFGQLNVGESDECHS